MNKKFFTAVSFACAMTAVLISATSCGCSNETSTTSSSSTIQTTQVSSQADTTVQITTEEINSTSEVKKEEKSTEEKNNTDSNKKNEEENKEADNKENKENNEKQNNNKEENKSNSSNSKVKEISLSESFVSLDKGSERIIKIYYSPSDAKDMSYTVSTDSDCVSVTCSGTEINVYGNRAGSCRLTVKTVSGITTSCNVEVLEEETEFVDENYDNPYKEYANSILKIVNEERGSRGLSEYRLRNDITKIANRRAIEISENYTHECPDGTYIWNVLVQSGVTNAASENIAYGQQTPEEVMNAWMNSQPHRESILSDKYNYIGIGYYEKDGVPYWVQIFIK